MNDRSRRQQQARWHADYNARLRENMMRRRDDGVSSATSSRAVQASQAQSENTARRRDAALKGWRTRRARAEKP